jgi:hypothetical protein
VTRPSIRVTGACGSPSGLPGIARPEGVDGGRPQHGEKTAAQVLTEGTPVHFPVDKSWLLGFRVRLKLVQDLAELGQRHDHVRVLRWSAVASPHRGEVLCPCLLRALLRLV